MISAISEGDMGFLKDLPLIDEDDMNWFQKAKTTEWSARDVKFFSDVPKCFSFVDTRRYLPKCTMATFVLTGHLGDQVHSEQREVIIYLTRRKFRWKFSLAIIRPTTLARI